MTRSKTLTTSQAAALKFVTQQAGLRCAEARREIDHILRMSNIPRQVFDQATAQIKSQARVALHFHPDRLCPNGVGPNSVGPNSPGPGDRSVAAALLDEGLYRSQFETGISNGGLSAHPGGARRRWETQIFGEAYEAPKASPKERPKYGALDLMLHPDGPSPRFGSCYLLLSPQVSNRCSFTYLDSHEDPDEKGTFEAFEDIAGALLRDAFVGDFALGEHNLTPTRLVDHLVAQLGQPFLDPIALPARRNLDHYIEAQVHGEISLETDADLLVADPSFAGTETGHALESLCLRYDIALYYHAGFALDLDEVPSDFRGPTMPSLAHRISTGDHIDAKLIGDAAVALKNDPSSFADRGSYDEVLQELKLLWHVLVRHGHPFRGFSD
jgi:hypothetical protein